MQKQLFDSPLNTKPVGHCTTSEMLCRFLTIKHAPFSTEMRIVSGGITAHSQQLLVKKVKVILMYLVSTTV